MIIRAEYIEEYARVREQAKLFRKSLITHTYADGESASSFLRELAFYESIVPLRVRKKLKDFSERKDAATGILERAIESHKEEIEKALDSFIRISPVKP